MDDRYALPKANLTILFRNPAVQHKWDEGKGSWIFDPEIGLHSGILFSIFLDALAQTTYDAELAGLHWSLDKTSSGLVLQCDGYSQHLTDFAIHLLEQFFNEEAAFINDKLVRTNKDRLICYLSSYLTSKRADTYASYYSNLLLSSQGFGVEDSLDLTKQVSTESILVHHRRLISRGLNKADCLISGNVSQREAENFFSRACQIVGSIGSTNDSNMQQIFDDERSYKLFTPGMYFFNAQNYHFNILNTELLLPTNF